MLMHASSGGLNLQALDELTWLQKVRYRDEFGALAREMDRARNGG